MKVLVIGGGGREHAVCKKLSESKDVTEILCAPGNAGIAQVARCIPEVKATDIEGIVALAQREKVDFVCVTPDDPLALGCVDRLEAAGIPAFGPTAYAAQMEASKIFSKNLMRKYGIPTAKSETFTEMDKALAYLDTQGAPIVVKADGLALGKGVVVAATVEEAKQAVVEMMQGGKFGQSGARGEAIRAASRRIPIVWSENFSVGVTVLVRLARLAAQALGREFDMEIVETHHNRKVDAPSGTAKLILRQIDPEGLYAPVYGRSGRIGARGREIGVHAVRGGTAAGEHSLRFFGRMEELELRHRADSREIFAQGALRAAAFARKAEPGLYDMEDVLFGGDGWTRS